MMPIKLDPIAPTYQALWAWSFIGNCKKYLRGCAVFELHFDVFPPEWTPICLGCPTGVTKKPQCLN